MDAGAVGEAASAGSEAPPVKVPKPKSPAQWVAWGKCKAALAEKHAQSAALKASLRQAKRARYSVLPPEPPAAAVEQVGQGDAEGMSYRSTLAPTASSAAAGTSVEAHGPFTSGHSYGPGGAQAGAPGLLNALGPEAYARLEADNRQLVNFIIAEKQKQLETVQKIAEENQRKLEEVVSQRLQVGFHADRPSSGRTGPLAAVDESIDPPEEEGGGEDELQPYLPGQAARAVRASPSYRQLNQNIRTELGRAQAHVARRAPPLQAQQWEEAEVPLGPAVRPGGRGPVLRRHATQVPPYLVQGPDGQYYPSHTPPPPPPPARPTAAAYYGAHPTGSIPRGTGPPVPMPGYPPAGYGMPPQMPPAPQMQPTQPQPQPPRPRNILPPSTSLADLARRA